MVVELVERKKKRERGVEGRETAPNLHRKRGDSEKRKRERRGNEDKTQVATPC